MLLINTAKEPAIARGTRDIKPSLTAAKCLCEPNFAKKGTKVSSINLKKFFKLRKRIVSNSTRIYLWQYTMYKQSK